MSRLSDDTSISFTATANVATANVGRVAEDYRSADNATRALMQDYYERLLAGGGRSEAMRQAQRAMLATPGREHPFYWASFIVSGNDAALDGRPIAPDFGKVQPGMRGCGCELVTPQGADTGAWAVVMMMAVFVRRHRRQARQWRRTVPASESP